jgi:hypothetical protein
MENVSVIFPQHGKNSCGFSTPWKTGFHSVEKAGVSFPYCGKKGSLKLSGDLRSGGLQEVEKGGGERMAGRGKLEQGAMVPDPAGFFHPLL